MMPRTIQRTIESLVLVGSGFILGGITHQIWLDYRQFQQAHVAYRNVDCRVAVRQFDRFLESAQVGNWLPDVGSWQLQARQEKRECQAFEAANQADRADQPDAAIAGYATFAQDLENSFLMSAVRVKTSRLLERYPSQRLVGSTTCRSLDHMVRVGAIAPHQPQLPAMYLACGQWFHEASDHARAFQAFDTVVEHYPTEPWVTQAIARRSQAFDHLTQAGLGQLSPQETQALNQYLGADQRLLAAQDTEDNAAPSASSWLTSPRWNSWWASPNTQGWLIRIGWLLLVGCLLSTYALAVYHRRRRPSAPKQRRRPRTHTLAHLERATLETIPHASTSLDPALENKLLGMVRGNRSTARRLIAFERAAQPGMSENWYWQAAIDRLVRDRC
jgi:hypothetical protein